MSKHNSIKSYISELYIENKQTQALIDSQISRQIDRQMTVTVTWIYKYVKIAQTFTMGNFKGPYSIKIFKCEHST